MYMHMYCYGRQGQGHEGPDLSTLCPELGGTGRLPGRLGSKLCFYRCAGRSLWASFVPCMMCELG